MKHLPPHLRPREKLLERGPSTLSINELIMILLGSGNRQRSVSEIARDVAKQISTLEKQNLEVLQHIAGLGDAKITTLVAAVELGRRLFVTEHSVRVISKSEDAVAEAHKIRSSRQENIMALYLNASNILLGTKTIAIGTATMCLAHPRDILWHGIEYGAVKIILIHNHPSGSLIPSTHDIAFTNQMANVCELLGFEFLEHLIVTRESWERIEI